MGVLTDDHAEHKVSSLVASAKTSFATLEYWLQAQTLNLHPLVTPMVKSINRVGRMHVETITTSIQVASDMHIGADDDILLCTNVLNKKSEFCRSKYMCSELILTADVSLKAINVAKKFEEVRHAYEKIVDGIPRIIAAVEKKYSQSEGIAVDNGRVIRVIDRFWGASGIQMISLADVKDQLNKAHRDLEELINETSSFAHWWDIDISSRFTFATVRALARCASPLVNAHAITLHKKEMPESEMEEIVECRRNSEMVKQSCLSYMQQIGVLQDFYPQAAKPGKTNVSFQLSKTGTNATIDPSHFFNDSAREINVDDLTQSALKAFSIIEPWYQAKTSCQGPLITSTVTVLVKQADAYRSAILESVQTAEDGYALASDAIQLYKCLIGENIYNAEDLTKFVRDMLSLAETAHGRALHTNELFRNVRQALYKIFQSVTFASDTEGIITLPASIQTETWIRDPKEITRRLNDAGRATKTKTILEIKQELNQAAKDVEELIRAVTNFVDWWGNIKIDLNSLITSIPRMNNDNPLRNATVRDRWTKLEKAYLLYTSRMSIIEDAYSLQRIFSSSRFKLGGRSAS